MCKFKMADGRHITVNFWRYINVVLSNSREIISLMKELAHKGLGVVFRHWSPF